MKNIVEASVSRAVERDQDHIRLMTAWHQMHLTTWAVSPKRP